VRAFQPAALSMALPAGKGMLANPLLAAGWSVAAVRAGSDFDHNPQARGASDPWRCRAIACLPTANGARRSLP